MVLDFISRFQNYNENGEVTQTFTNGCCFWFAKILTDRFPEGKIVYNPVANHFAAELWARYYDITGEIQDITGYSYWAWYQHYDPIHYDRLTQQCINF